MRKTKSEPPELNEWVYIYCPLQIVAMCSCERSFRPRATEGLLLTRGAHCMKPYLHEYIHGGNVSTTVSRVELLQCSA